MTYAMNSPNPARRSRARRNPARVEPLDARRMLHATISGLNDLTVARNASATTIGLSSKIDDPTVEGTVVDMKYDLGTVRVAMLDKTSPRSSANFLRYADAGRYDNTIIHRSVAGFIVQGGGFKTDFSAVEDFSPIENEFGPSNLRGTMAFAKIGGDPDSATNEWFYNLANNSANLDAQNEGFSVFARVVGNGLVTVDRIAAKQIYNLGSPFDTIPLDSYDGNDQPTTDEVVLLRDVARVPLVADSTKITVSSTNSEVVSAKITGSRLVLTYGRNRTGTAAITVTTTAVDGDKVSDTFNVRVGSSTGSLSGTVFYDTNRDKKRTGTESNQEGYRVFLDFDNDGRLDSNESSVLTDDDGRWTFANLNTATYTVRVIPGSGFRSTSPGAKPLTVRAGETNGATFGITRS